MRFALALVLSLTAACGGRADAIGSPPEDAGTDLDAFCPIPTHSPCPTDPARCPQYWVCGPDILGQCSCTTYTDY